MWRGWTAPENAAAYESYLTGELFPRVQRELGSLGYLGYHVLRRNDGNEIEFVTLVWFESLATVQAFAGANYEAPVITEKAARLLSHYEPRCEHFEVRGSALIEQAPRY
jgi:hypothetical protein